MPFTHIALLRGINVGGKHLLPMKELARIFSQHGCDDVRTYIQSGNVYFRADPSLCGDLSAAVKARISEQFGYQVSVIVRSQEQMQHIIRNNPFLAGGSAEDVFHIAFLANVPNLDRISAQSPERSPSDGFLVQGQEVYLRLPNGVANTKLTNAYFDSKLATVSTIRSWRTATRLLALMNE